MENGKFSTGTVRLTAFRANDTVAGSGRVDFASLYTAHVQGDPP